MSAEEWEAKCLQLELELEELRESSRLYEEELFQEMECLTRKESQLQHELEKARELFHQTSEELNQSHKEETRKMFQLAQEKETSEERGNKLMQALRAMETKTETFENRDRISREELLICQSRLEESIEENEFLKVEIEDLERFISNLQKQAGVLKEELASLQVLKSNTLKRTDGATLELRATILQLEKEKQDLKDAIEMYRANEAARMQLQEEHTRMELTKQSNEAKMAAQLLLEQQEKKLLRDELEQLRSQLVSARNLAQKLAAKEEKEGFEADVPVVTVTAALSEQELEAKQQVATTRVDQIEQQLFQRAEAAKIRRTLDRPKSAMALDTPVNVPFDIRLAQEKQQRAERKATLETYHHDKQMVLKNEPRHSPPPRPFLLNRDIFLDGRTRSRSPNSTLSRASFSNPVSPESLNRKTSSPRRRSVQEDQFHNSKEPKLNQVSPLSTSSTLVNGRAATVSSAVSSAVTRFRELATVQSRPARGRSLDDEPVVIHPPRPIGSQTLNLPSRPPPATPGGETKRRVSGSAPPSRQPPATPNKQIQQA